MAIIQNMITKHYSPDEKINNIIAKSVELKELNTYLYNLDIQASLSKHDELTVGERKTYSALEYQNAKLLHILQNKILEISISENINMASAAFYANNIMCELSNKMDMGSMHKEQYTYVSKVYIVAKILLDNTKRVTLEQKTL